VTRLLPVRPLVADAQRERHGARALALVALSRRPPPPHTNTHTQARAVTATAAAAPAPARRASARRVAAPRASPAGRPAFLPALRAISPPGETTATSTTTTNPLDRAPDALPTAFLPSADPWTDPKYAGVQWTVYRGVAYDLTGFLDAHPAGVWLVRLALGRDSTALFESYHLRPEVAAARLRRLPVLEGFPVHAVPPSPRPNDSDLYNTLRSRVREEVFGGGEASGAHRSGSEGAIAAVLGAAVVAYSLYAAFPGWASGALLGAAGAWIGLTVQHCGNHGAMSTVPWVNAALGACDDLIGGSSLAWQYHHQVSHHVHCNDDAFDEDVFSSFVS
jgi:acyl-lipid (7-3)-desaturase (Delta-4 desaturase)